MFDVNVLTSTAPPELDEDEGATERHGLHHNLAEPGLLHAGAHNNAAANEEENVPFQAVHVSLVKYAGGREGDGGEKRDHGCGEPRPVICEPEPHG